MHLKYLAMYNVSSSPDVKNKKMSVLCLIYNFITMIYNNNSERDGLIICGCTLPRLPWGGSKDFISSRGEAEFTCRSVLFNSGFWFFITCFIVFCKVNDCVFKHKVHFTFIPEGQQLFASLRLSEGKSWGDVRKHLPKAEILKRWISFHIMNKPQITGRTALKC